MSKNIPKNTCTAMIKKSKEKLKKIIIKLRSSTPKTELESLVQKYGIEHTKIIGWQNGYYVFEECQLNGPIDLIFMKINNDGKLIQYNIDAKGIHPRCNYFPQGKRRTAIDKFKKRNSKYERLQSISWRVEDKNFTHQIKIKKNGTIKKKFFEKGFIVFKDSNNVDVTDKIIKAF